jgi:membrane protease YdiL (CAAX protease family)
VKRFFQSGIGAVVAWMLCSLVLAAVISPWVYQGGKLLAAAAEARDLPAVLEWLGAACGRAKFGRFFDRSMLIAALVLLPLLFRRIHWLKSVPGTRIVDPRSRVLWRSALLQALTGCVIAGGLLWCMGAVLEAAGAFEPKAQQPELGKLIPKIFLPALVVSLLEEWIFRGLLLGLWLRYARPLTACIGSSLLFAFLHFLKPPASTVIGDPAHVLAGFELFGKILLHFTEPLFFITAFASLFLVGLILAWARVRTGALWFSIGLHAGWILAFKGFNKLYQDVPNHPLPPWGVGEDLRSGVLPLVALLVTALICHFVLRKFEPANPPTASRPTSPD